MSRFSVTRLRSTPLKNIPKGSHTTVAVDARLMQRALRTWQGLSARAIADLCLAHALEDVTGKDCES